MIWLYILRNRLDVEGLGVKSVEIKNLNGNGVSNGNGLIKDKAVIINETNGEQENFLNSGQ